MREPASKKRFTPRVLELLTAFTGRDDRAMAIPTILLTSTDSSLVRAVEDVVASVGRCKIEVLPGMAEMRSQIYRDDVALLLVHMLDQTDDSEVVALLRGVTSTKRPIPTLVVSERDNPIQAVRLLRLGVADCLSRPLDLSRLAFLMDALTVRARFAERLCPAPVDLRTVRSLGETDPFLYLTPEMQRIVDQVQAIAPQDTTILFNGETGTGKTRLARLVHEISPRRDAPFVILNCAALSTSLIESELFGHVKGAFTGADQDRAGKFAEAGAGTLLLDDIDTLPAALQGKLLRAVDERVFERVGSNKSEPIRARLLAASNRSLEAEVAAGRFRADFYYRINVVSFHLPPLRERRLVIRPLVDKFVSEYSSRTGRIIQGSAADALRALEAYHWPGNLRELRNVIERAVALCRGVQIGLDDLPDAVRAAVAETKQPIREPFFQRASVLGQSRIQAEVARILEALDKHGNNRLQAAVELGISRMTLYRKLHRYGLI